MAGGGTGGSCASPGIKINEVSTRGVNASDEFVELYNLSQNVITLTGYTITVAGADGANPVVIWTGTSSDEITSQDFFVIGGATFSGADSTFIVSNALPNDGGIGLTSATTTDAVAWGTLSTPNHPFQEGQPTSNGATGTSMARIPNGEDCNDNATDFELKTRSPGASNNP
jgi:hypothetical protein